MLKALALVLSLCLSLVPMALAGAREIDPSTSTGISASNVEWVTTIPLEAGTWTGARVFEEHLYVAGSKSFSIYDISDPESPQLLSITPIGFQFVNEDVDTNGEILLLSDDRVQKKFHVWDVSDPTQPVKLAELAEMPDHTFACVLDCTWAYGAGGSIIDLKDPSNPRPAGRWHEPMPGLWGFDTFEVKPGVVITASQVMHLLDGRKNPAKPKVLANGAASDNRYLHSIRWPNRGRDRFILVQGEQNFRPRCDETAGAFMTYDATTIPRHKSFNMIDEFRVKGTGSYVDGNPPANVVGCSPSWFQEHPSFKDGGLVVSSFFEHGTRILDVDARGRISEVGHFTPLGGVTTASYWANEEIIYSVDLTHGIDVLRYTGR